MRLEDEIKQTRHFRSPFERALVNVLFTSKWLEGLQLELLKPFDLTVQQYNILRILRGSHPTPVTVKTLRERMLDKMSDASRLVEKLRKKGFVQRKSCRADRRNVDVTITSKGLDALGQIDKSAEALEKRFHSLSETEASQLGELLDKMRG